MIQRRKPLRRKTPLKRGGFIRRKTPIRRISKVRSSHRRQYARDREEYLREHRVCQIFLARHRISERSLRLNSWFDLYGETYVLIAGRTTRIPRATQIHHRNKARGERLLDKRWWIAASAEEHEWVESNKDEARELGLLLPIQADEQGRWGSDQQALVTEELIESRARGGPMQ